MLLFAWLAWLTFDKKDVISVKSTTKQDIIMGKILEDKMVEMDRVMESVRIMREGINLTDFRSMRSVAGAVNAVSLMVQTGEQLVRTMGVVKNIILAPLQSAIDALEEKVREVQNRIDGLTEDEKQRIPSALQKLFEVQRDLVITRESLASLAGTTIRRVNGLIQVISKIGRRSKGVDARVKILLRKFDTLLQNSEVMLKAAFQDYKTMSSNLNEIRSDLSIFGKSVMRQAESMEAEMRNYIKSRRAAAYGGCAGALIVPLLVPLCYLIAAPVLEADIAGYKERIQYLKTISMNSSVEALKLAQETKDNEKYIEEELILITRWNTKIVEVSDSYTEVFNDEVDLVQYIELTGKKEAVQMLCDLSKVCRQYLEHKNKYSEYEGIPAEDIPIRHRLCNGFQCPKPSSLIGRNPPQIDRVNLADIEMLASLGDSLSAAAQFENDVHNVWDEEEDHGVGNSERTLKENKRISFVTGSTPDVMGQTTLFNVLEQYNPTLQGGSSGSTMPGSSPTPTAGLNFATSGASIRDANGQAKKLISALRVLNPEMEDKWKLVTIQFGIQDLCSAPAPEEWVVYLSQALQTLQDNAGKTIVLLMMPFDVSSLLRPRCEASRSLYQCSWINSGEQCKGELLENRRVLEDIIQKTAQHFRTMTFAVEVLPTLKDFKVDTATSDDCLHPDKPHMSMIGKNLWNNFMTPVSLRKSVYNSSLELLCPDPDAPIPVTLPTLLPVDDSGANCDGADVLKVKVTEKSYDYVKIQIKNEDGQVCTTNELNTGGQMWTEFKGQHSDFNFKSSVLSAHDTECQQALSADTLYFKLTTEKQRGRLDYDQICVDQVELDFSRMKFTWRGHTCVKGSGSWERMNIEHATCG